MRGKRRDLAITTSAWLEPISNEKWQYWEGCFQKGIPLNLRRKIDLCLLDLKNAKSRHYSKERVSVSDLRKRIKRLLRRTETGLPLDDPFAEDQVYRHNLGDQEGDFIELAMLTLEYLGEDSISATMPALKPESIFTRIMFEHFKDAGMTVNLTSGNTLEFANSSEEALPTPIEEFVLVHVWERERFTFREIEKIQKNIKRFQNAIDF